MKKASLIWKLGAAALFLMPLNSCTNLDENLYSQVETEDFLRNEEEVKAAVGAAYTRLYGLMNHGSYFSTQEVNSNEVMYPQRGNDWYDGGQWINTHRHTQTGGEDCYNNAWNFLYAGVNTCNRLILQVSQAQTKGNLDATTAAAYNAELRGLRALFYYWLLDSFGNVPIVDKFDLPAGFQPATAARKDVYAFVVGELEAIKNNLVKAATSATYGRFTYYAAEALLAKCYLNAGVYTGTTAYDKAIAAADAVTSSGKFALAANYRDNFVTQNAGSPEMILAIPYDKVFAQGFNIAQMTLHYASQATFNLQAQPWNGVCVAQDFYESYDASDARRSNFLSGPQFASDGVTPLTDPSADDPDGAPLNYTKEINELEPKCQRQAGVRIGKFEFENGATPNLSNDMPILRFADIWLTKAEAVARSKNNWSDQAVLDHVNAVRTRARLGTVSSLTAEEFLAERSRETFYEGWRRSDLVRFGKFNEPRGMRTAASSAERQLWPIPNNQLAANPNLKQNPGY